MSTRIRIGLSRRSWRARRDSNPRPLGPQPNALSAELRAHLCHLRLAQREGFEPSMQVTPHGGLANRCTRPLCDLSVAAAGDILTCVPGPSGRGSRRSSDLADASLRCTTRTSLRGLMPRRHLIASWEIVRARLSENGIHDLHRPVEVPGPPGHPSEPCVDTRGRARHTPLHTCARPSTFDARHERLRSLRPGARVVPGERSRGQTSAFLFGRPRYNEETAPRCSS